MFKLIFIIAFIGAQGPQPIGYLETPGLYADKNSCEVASAEYLPQSAPGIIIAYDCIKQEVTNVNN